MVAPHITAEEIVFRTSKEFLHINEKDVKSSRKYAKNLNKKFICSNVDGPRDYHTE